MTTPAGPPADRDDSAADAPDQGATAASFLPSRDLDRILRQGQEYGFIGPGDIDPHVTQAVAFAAACPVVPTQVLDLGSGGGLPGLVLAEIWRDTELVLLDASEQRTEFLEVAAARLGVADRVRVVRGRAEVLGRDADLRGAFDLVVVRLFGAPAVAAECGAGFLSPGGTLLVSEPPDSDGRRWDHPASLAELGLERRTLVTVDGYGFQPLVAEHPCPDRYPRRVGIPAKRPLF